MYFVVSGQSITTNNDIEGYHRHLIGNAGSSHIAFYVVLCYSGGGVVRGEALYPHDGEVMQAVPILLFMLFYVTVVVVVVVL